MKTLADHIQQASPAALVRIMRKIDRRLQESTGHTRVYYAATKTAPQQRLEPAVAKVYRSLKREAATTPRLADTLYDMNLNTIRYATQILRQLGLVISCAES